MDLNAIYQKMVQNRAIHQEISEASEMFAFKPFAIEFRPVRTIAFYGRWALAGFSIITGFTALADPFSSTLPIWLAYLVASILLVSIEGIKSIFGRIVFRQYYASRSISPLFFPTLFCFGLSVWLSLSGVQSLYSQLDESSENLTIAYKVQSDSIAHVYNVRIQEAKIDAQGFFKSNNYLGTITYTRDGSIAKQYARLQDRVLELESERKTVLQKLDHEQTSAVSELAKKTGFNTFVWICISGTNEVLILLSVWFLVYYTYRLKEDSEIFTAPAAPDPFTFNLSELANLLQTIANQTLPPSTIPAAVPAGGNTQIGFRIGNKTQHIQQPAPPQAEINGLNTPIKEGEKELKAFLSKYPEVVKLLQAGEGIGKVSHVCKVSKSTVQNVRRCLKMLEG